MGTERKPPTSAEELLERYAAGERDFRGATLRGANLGAADLCGVNLSAKPTLTYSERARDRFLWDQERVEMAGRGLQFKMQERLEALALEYRQSASSSAPSSLSNGVSERRTTPWTIAREQGGRWRDRHSPSGFPSSIFRGVGLPNYRSTAFSVLYEPVVRLDALWRARANAEGVNLNRWNRAPGGTDLRGANLMEADLSGADLSGADLEEADLTHAYLVGTNLAHANLRRADLSLARLTRAMFLRTCTEATSVAVALVADTTFRDTDLTGFSEADPPLIHTEPSSVDYRSVIRSIRAPRLKEFLLRTGMPEVFIEYMIDCARSLDPAGVFKMLQSTFISYGGPDTNFAQRLDDALLKNGVATFFFAKHAIPGNKLHRLMRDGVNQHDRVILVCSKASLDRPGVVNEITEALQREARDGGKEYLIPITLDDHVFDDWKPHDPGVAQAIRDRVVADFRGADADKARFDAGVLKLIAALKK
jgi:uncharacterized protein YjbI with pentapeptide repeats